MAFANFKPGTNLGGYVVEEKIGRGATGTIYTAQTPDNVGVVLKCFPLKSNFIESTVLKKNPENFNKDFKTEIQSLDRCTSCPCIVKMFDHFTSGSTGVIVMEKMETDLLELMIEERVTSVFDAKIVFKQVCIAVEGMHNNSLAHMDIKPENIFLNNVRNVRLGDLGSSCLFQPGTKIQKFSTMVSKHYCPPEIVSRMKILLLCHVLVFFSNSYPFLD